MGALKIKFIGLGISMESAIYFSGIQKKSDFIKYQLAYLNSNGLRVNSKFVRENEQGFDYDIYHTQKGLIWFKRPSSGIPEKSRVYC